MLFNLTTTADAAELLRHLRTTHANEMPLPAWLFLFRAESRLNAEIQRYFRADAAPQGRAALGA